jgi:hypothetical protein
MAEEEPMKELLFPNLVEWQDGNVLWYDPPDRVFSKCVKVTTVFGVAVCVTHGAWFDCNKEEGCPARRNHVVHVLYQLLDNDANGVVDDPKLVDEMVHGKYILVVLHTDWDLVYFDYDDMAYVGAGAATVTGLFESVPNSCDVPANRGADPHNRSTWSEFVEVNDDMGCDQSRDATVEEILHLLTIAASVVYPSLWDENYGSTAGAAIEAANGDCGWGYSGDSIDPSSGDCSGQFAYNDETCDEYCIVVEGIYWAIISYIGGLYTTERSEGISDEWMMGTPDASMSVLPEGVNNAISLEEGSPELYALVSDTTSEGHTWLPEIMPDGNYTVNRDGAVGPDGEGAKCRRLKNWPCSLIGVDGLQYSSGSWQRQWLISSSLAILPLLYS